MQKYKLFLKQPNFSFLFSIFKFYVYLEIE